MSRVVAPYPEHGRERDDWILSRRQARNPLDPRRPFAFFIEDERAASGEIVPTATVFLTNRECPWRCLMCDLWKNTLTETVPVGAIPEQIDWALARLHEGCGTSASDAPRQIKLYNSGSFFDPRAIPLADHAAIIARGRGFERVIVECHPAFIGPAVVRFHEQLGGTLEVALGLETAHPGALTRINKRMTVEQFSRAAAYLKEHAIALRVFLLVHPPFLDTAEAPRWAERSMECAFDCGASVVSLIPTRPGNGALEALAERGEFTPPTLRALETVAAHGVSLGRGRVLADTWDLEKFSDCAACFAPRLARLKEMNLHQVVPPLVTCAECESV